MAQDMIGQCLGYTGLSMALHRKRITTETVAVEHMRRLTYMLSKPSKILRIYYESFETNKLMVPTQTMPLIWR